MTKDEEQTLFQQAPELGRYVCRQCGKCTCPEGIDISEIFACEGYYDRQMARGDVDNTAEYALAERLRFWFKNQELGRKRYNNLQIRADACIDCRKCLSQCPYQIDIPKKLHLADYKLAGKNIF